MFDTLKQGYLHRERESLHGRQAWKELAEACRKLVAIDPSDFKAVHDLVVALRELKDFPGALPWCEAILRIAPKGTPELMAKIAKEKALSDALTAELKAAVTEFKGTYKAR